MDWKSLPDENSYRFIAIFNKKIEVGKLMNALGHMTAGLTGKVGKNLDFNFIDYQDQGGGLHPAISHFPFIVLSADNSNKIRSVRNQAIERHIIFTDFTSTMTLGTSQQQFEATANTKESDLEYYGILMFGKTEELKELTSKFSLYK